MTPPPSPEHKPAQGLLFGVNPNPTTLAEEIDKQKTLNQEEKDQVDAMRQYLEDLSKDMTGTKPEDCLPPKDAAACTEFIDQYGQLDSPHKTKLKLEVARSGEKLWGKGTENQPLGMSQKPKIWGTGARYHQIPLITIWEGEGFFIENASTQVFPGHFGGEQVYLCTDGMLRCTRTTGIFTDSYATGVGTLPKEVHLTPEEIIEYTDVGDHMSGTEQIATPLLTVLGHYALEIDKLHQT